MCKHPSSFTVSQRGTKRRVPQVEDSHHRMWVRDPRGAHQPHAANFLCVAATDTVHSRSDTRAARVPIQERRHETYIAMRERDSHSETPNAQKMHTPLRNTLAKRTSGRSTGSPVLCVDGEPLDALSQREETTKLHDIIVR